MDSSHKTILLSFTHPRVIPNPQDFGISWEGSVQSLKVQVTKKNNVL